jgi:integrase/recombinase XerD
MRQAQVLSDKDKQRILSHVAKNSFPARNRAMLMLNWLAGMRVGEIAALRFEDVVDATGEVRSQIQLSAEQTKGDEARTVLISSQLKQELVNYTITYKTTPKSQLPFIASKTGKPFSPNGLCLRFIQLYKAAAANKATSHSGRRTFITNLANKGVNVRVLAALAAHKHISTTQRYIDLNEEVLKAAIELA